jgi:hypothetical protein
MLKLCDAMTAPQQVTVFVTRGDAEFGAQLAIQADGRWSAIKYPGRNFSGVIYPH